MYEYEYLRAEGTTRNLIFWNPNRQGEMIAHLNDWTGYEADIESIDIDGTVATIIHDGGRITRFQLDTSSNIASEI